MEELYGMCIGYDNVFWLISGLWFIPYLCVHFAIYKRKDCEMWKWQMWNGKMVLALKIDLNQATEWPLTFALGQKRAITIIINGLVSRESRGMVFGITFSPFSGLIWKVGLKLSRALRSHGKIQLFVAAAPCCSSAPCHLLLALLLLANKWLAMRTIAGNSSWPPSSNCSLNRRQKRSAECGGRKMASSSSSLRIAFIDWTSSGARSHTHLKVSKTLGKITS